MHKKTLTKEEFSEELFSIFYLPLRCQELQVDFIGFGSADRGHVCDQRVPVHILPPEVEAPTDHSKNLP